MSVELSRAPPSKLQWGSLASRDFIARLGQAGEAESQDQRVRIHDVHDEASNKISTRWGVSLRRGLIDRSLSARSREKAANIQPN
jgi:hypothetical protein